MSRRPLIALGLRGRLVGAVSIALAGLLAVTGVLVVLRSQAALLEVQESHFVAVARQLAEAIRYPVLARSSALLQPSLEVFSRTPDLLEVQILDEGGGELARVEGSGAPRDRRGDSRVGTVQVAVPVTTAASAPGDDGGELATFGLAAQGEPRLIGKVVATFSTASAVRIQARVRNEFILAFFAVGGLGVLAVLWLAASVVRRARRLAGAAARVAHGDLGVRVETTGADELAALAHDFNAMTAALGEQRRALDEAAAQLAEREALSAIGRATAVIAHELKNPLGILLGAAEIAANPERPEAARRKAAQIIGDEVRRLERTLGQLLHYARPTPPSRTPVDALALCRSVAERAVYPGGPAQEVALTVDGQPLSALVDEAHASQILLNLITNAAQAGAQRIGVTVQPAAERIRIDVVDDGPGIDAEVRDQLFRPFVTTKQHGAGLGLAGSRRLARDNGGDLRLEEAAAGAHFVLELAAAPAQEKQP
ncbi:MAG: HAMP domain-containing histidine kinase [Deltaproteobacteria bacterium]|nr:HAMP domain-containing histidine kinase [Deltaproteobacteria bacterium]